MANLFVATTNIFLWKHWKCLRFSWIKNLLLIVVPILLAWGQIYAFYSVTKGQQIVFEPLDNQQVLQYFPSGNEDLIYYTPRTSIYNELIENVRQKLEIIEERILPFDTEEELYEDFQMNKKNRNFAIIFHDTAANTNELQVLNYTIQTRNNNFKTDQIFLDDVYSILNKETDEYIDSGFLALQYSLNKAFMEMQSTRNSTEIEFEYEKFPANARDSRHFIGITPTIITLFFIYMLTLMSMVLVPMVEEKEDGVKEFLRIASSFSYMNNVTFFIISVAFGFIIFGVSLAIAGHFGFMNHIPPLWLCILIGLYIISAVAYTFLMSVLFDSVFYAKTAGFLCFIAPFLIIMFNTDRLKWIIPVFNSALLYNGITVFDSFGMKGLIFSCSNLNDEPMGLYSMLQTYLLLTMDIVLYLILYFYLSQVFPGKCGTPRPFYFPLMMCFKLNKETATHPMVEEENALTSNNDVAVKIRNLRKVYRSCFGKGNEAVKDLSMNIYRNQITVLLGHNGAGKTTTMSMITGIIPKTSGFICVDGKTDVNEYRHQIGYCPQHNVFMRYFTCIDHLLFFGGLRGLDTAKAKEQGRLLLDRLDLRDKAIEYGKNLSGGMKRRLCLGNALIGNTKIAILDEPSSGLDPESRRELWNILLDMRKDHTILLTTHYMEEAEILADKIAIIAEGKQLCFDTSLKLKRMYAGGYVLKLLTNENFKSDNEYKILFKVKEFVPNADVIKPFVPPTLNIRLPYENINNFSLMLEEIEKNMQNLGILSIGISNSSLEDVFLSFGKHVDSGTDEVDGGFQPFCIPDTFKTSQMGRIQLLQISAIIYKKLIYMRQKWLYWLLLFSFPIAAIIISFVSINANIAHHVQSKPLSLNLKHIYNPEILVYLDRNIGKTPLYNSIIKHVIEDDFATVRYLNNSYTTIEDELLAIERENMTHYHERLPAALAIYKKWNDDGHIHVKILFSGNAIHSSASALNLASNILLKINAGTRYSIESKNEPLKKEKTIITRTDLDIYLMFLPIAMFFYVLFYVFLPFNEEKTEFKKLQLISPIVYWGTYYIFDLFVHTIYCLIIYGVHVAADTNNIFGSTEYTLLATIYLFYAIAYIPLLYNVSQWFNTMSSLYSFLSYMFVAMNILASFMSSSQDNMESFSTWIMFLLVFPDYALRHAISAIIITFTKTQNSKINIRSQSTYTRYLPETSSYIGSSDVLDLRRYYIYMMAVAVLLLIFLVVIWENIVRREKLINFLKLYKKCRRKRPSIQRFPSQTTINNDEKELTEEIIKNDKQKDFAIIVSNLQKQFEGVHAVDGINFTVKKGECFGLLGMNGAGKTTTFKIMTSQTAPTKGDIFYAGRNSTKDSIQYKLMFGYCPQVDALNGYMTGYETLKYMGMCRGIPWNKIHNQVERWIKQTDLVPFAHINVCNYSGGTKRKLNTALAMIADPSLVFLDEPTTGVDPISRRFVWSCIQNCQKYDKNIILTSHSMDECEYLCNRLAIMVSGQLKCIGPIQKLKSDFGLGFVVIFLLKEKRLSSPIHNSMQKIFKECKLQEEYAGKIRYIVADKNLKWSEIFQKIQAIKHQHADDIDDVSICETSLEDIFLKIAHDSSLIDQVIVSSDV